MPDEPLDPDLDWVRAQWEAPPPTRGFHDRVLGAYVREAGVRPMRHELRLPILVAAAILIAVVAGGILVSPGLHQRPVVPKSYSLRPVSQPHFIIVSQGEHP